jgi:hypothetical protein
MSKRSQFAYVQARLQARHGLRPSEQVWRQLQGIGDVRNYLYVARRTSLKNWVMGINGTHSCHEIEYLLREQFSSHVDEVAGWMPVQWAEPVRWVKRLPYLPALLHLLTGRTAPAWMRLDPMMAGLTSETLKQRNDALERSVFASLAADWHAGTSLTHAWLVQWQKLLPPNARNDTGIQQLADLLWMNASATPAPPQTDTHQLRLDLDTRLGRLFRRHSFQAAAAFAHLGLTALDLENLRSDLVLRSVYPGAMRATP